MALKSNYSPRKYGTILDLAHILIGVLILILAVIAFTNPYDNSLLFPIIFFLAALLNLMTGWFYIKMYPRMKKKRASGIGYLVSGGLIFLLCVLSAVSLWGGV